MFKPSKLKPCPYCGGEAFVKELLGHQYIECKHKSRCLIAPNTWLQSSQPLRKQIRAWNRRSK